MLLSHNTITTPTGEPVLIFPTEHDAQFWYGCMRQLAGMEAAWMGVKGRELLS